MNDGKERNMNAYAVGHLTDVNMGNDIREYLARIDATLAPFGGRFLIHGEAREPLEGELAGDIVVIAFPDLAHARQWYASPAYQAILPLRAGNATSTVFLVQGVPDDHKATDILRGPEG
jgi:uncharacterized protein (DUF1330 family)